jgi:serine/threonine-protein kinase
MRTFTHYLEGKKMSETDKMINKKIGRYEIKEVLGEGAMAMVYRAYDPEINRSVACKILKAEHCVDEEYTSRFLREAKAAGSLSHSSIVTVFDVGEIEGAPYIMELIEGNDLGVILEEKQPLTLKQTLTIMLHLAKALDYAHNTKIVHRDIKPDNIILLPDNESIKVADFGIARISENEEAQKTQLGSVLGTPRYMSPEQALGSEIDGRSDLFSVGTIMYEMLTGNKAFDAQNMGTLMMQIAQEQPTTIKSINPNIPVGVRQIVQKLLQKTPEKRFQDGASLATAIISELTALQEQQDEQKKHKYIPLKYKLTLFAVSIVSLVLIISMNMIYSKQSDAMTKAAVDSGSSFAKFIANETAVPLLSEDWITLETFINDAASRDTFSYLIVTDRDGVIRGASDATLVGQSYQADENAELISETEDVLTTSSSLENDYHVFNITTPVLFQSTEVGSIVLGLSQKSLDEVKSTTGRLMFFLAAITLSAIALIMFVFGALISKPLRTISRNLTSFGEGDLDARISLERSDEIGRVILSFNQMASSVQKRYTKVADELAQSGILTSDTSGDSLAKMPLSNLSTDPNQSDEDVSDATVVARSIIHKSEESLDDATVIARPSDIPKESVNADADTSENTDKKEQKTAGKAVDNSVQDKKENAKKPVKKTNPVAKSKSKSDTSDTNNGTKVESSKKQEEDDADKPNSSEK